MPNINLESGKFRYKKVYFSQVSNTALRDDKLSLKAKGLYSLIQSYITLENFTLYKSTLYNKCIEKEKAFESAWNELKDNGYLKQYRIRSAETNKYVYEYDLLDEPNMVQPALLNIGINGEIIQNTNTKQNTVEEVDSKKHTKKIENLNPPQKVGGSKRTRFVSNPVQNGGYINNTDQSNTDQNNTNQSFNHENYENYQKDDDRLIDVQSTVEKYGIYKTILSENINLESLKAQHEPIDAALIDEILDLLAETLSTNKTNTRVCGEDKPIEIVKAQLLKLTDEHITYVISCLKKNTTKVQNIKAYLLTALYNAPSTINAYFQNQFKSDYYQQPFIDK